MSEEEAFLSRWSRLKRTPPEPAEPVAEGAGECAAAETSVSIEPAQAGPAPAAEDEISPEELARLPRLEALTAQSNVAAFLRAGVPQALRNAALRRVWALDPAIRDFVCEAREYAYDWNAPDGVPGFGPLTLSKEQVAAMVEGLFGRPPAAAEDSGGQSGEAAAAGAESGVARELAELPPPRPPLAMGGELDGAVPREPLAAPRSAAEGEQPLSAAEETPAFVRARRHGGATPV